MLVFYQEFIELFTENVPDTQTLMIGHGVWNNDKKLTGDYLPTSTFVTIAVLE